MTPQTNLDFAPTHVAHGPRPHRQDSFLRQQFIIDERPAALSVLAAVSVVRSALIGDISVKSAADADTWTRPECSLNSNAF